MLVLMFGARFLVVGPVSIVRGFGVSESFIGLTIVAVDTSLPELATSIIAAFRRQSGIAIGNIVGSNIFNVLGILGVTALIKPVPVADRFLTFDHANHDCSLVGPDCGASDGFGHRSRNGFRRVDRIRGICVVNAVRG
jgi:Ca2+/Na+ antiporter